MELCTYDRPTVVTQSLCVSAIRRPKLGAQIPRESSIFQIESADKREMDLTEALSALCPTCDSTPRMTSESECSVSLMTA